MMVIGEKFEMGESVYLKIDIDQQIRIVTGYTIRPGGQIVYLLSSGTEETSHYDLEITVEKNILVLI